MPQAVEVTRLGPCSSCGSNAAVNTPTQLPNGNILCYRCADVHAFTQREPEFLYGIEQSRYAGRTVLKQQYDHIRHRMLIAHTTADKMHIAALWWRSEAFGVTHAFPLSDTDKSEKPEALLRLVAELVEAGFCRCTGCSEELKISEIAGFPLFAGVACKDCWEKYKDLIRTQKRTGQVCRMCRQPWALCCC